MDVKIDITGIVLQTPRLILREWRESDLNDLYEYASVDGVGEMAGWKRHGSIEETREILKMFMTGKDVFALQLKTDGKVVGSLGLHPPFVKHDALYKNVKVKEIGYALSRDYWGQGLMPEAVKAVIDYCFGIAGLDALTVGHFVGNSQSRRVIEKCGFTRAGSGEYFSKQLDRTFEEIYYIMYRQ